MEREQILRSDFPTARKGWSPAAVQEHLRAVADSNASEAADGAGDGPSLADVAADRVRNVIAAAEEQAAEIEREARTASERLLSGARDESEGLLAGARAEADRLVAAAREEAAARVEQARAAVEGLITQAGELRTRVGTLGEELAGDVGPAAGAGVQAEVPGPVIVPEPGPVIVPEPTPPRTPEPTPDPVPEPTPDPVPEPTPPGPAPDLPDAPEPVPPVPEPAPTPPAAESNGASTEDLIAQLRAGSSAAPANGEPTLIVSPADLGAARLVAMNMALEGASREEIAQQIGTEFGDALDLDGLLDEVLARAGR